MLLSQDVSLDRLEDAIQARYSFQSKFFDYDFADEQLKLNKELYDLVKSGKASYNDIQKALILISNPMN